MGMPGRWRRRGNRVLRWGGLASAALIVSAFLVSIRLGFGVQAPLRRSETGVLCINAGMLKVLTYDTTIWTGPAGWSIDAWPAGEAVGWMPYHKGGGGSTTTVLPLWILLVVVSAPTFIAWRCHLRRSHPGLCPACSYSLSGLAIDAPCPECGRRTMIPTR